MSYKGIHPPKKPQLPSAVYSTVVWLEFPISDLLCSLPSNGILTIYNKEKSSLYAPFLKEDIEEFYHFTPETIDILEVTYHHTKYEDGEESLLRFVCEVTVLKPETQYAKELRDYGRRLENYNDKLRLYNSNTVN